MEWFWQARTGGPLPAAEWNKRSETHRAGGECFSAAEPSESGEPEICIGKGPGKKDVLRGQCELVGAGECYSTECSAEPAHQSNPSE